MDPTSLTVVLGALVWANKTANSTGGVDWKTIPIATGILAVVVSAADRAGFPMKPWVYLSAITVLLAPVAGTPSIVQTAATLYGQHVGTIPINRSTLKEPTVTAEQPPLTGN